MRGKRKLKVGVDIPTPDEVRRIIEAATGRRRPLLLTAIFTGLRASELRGLRWVDVDLKRGELHVHQRADRYCVIGHPKSAKGARTIPLGPLVLNTLKEWKLACPTGELGLVFPTSKGRIEQHANIRPRSRAGVDRRWADGQGRQAEVHGPACAAAFLCILVHQPEASTAGLNCRLRWCRSA